MLNLYLVNVGALFDCGYTANNLHLLATNVTHVACSHLSAPYAELHINYVPLMLRGRVISSW